MAYQEAAPPQSDAYPLPPEATRQPGVPAGKTFNFQMKSSKIFPGTTRSITVYIPDQYKGNRAACVYVGLDSLNFNAATVFDNLIAQRAMPVTIGIGVSSGTVDSRKSPEDPRFDRSLEFDSRDDRLARFLLEEVFPAVESHKTPDGRPILLSDNGNDRMIGGASTGGIGSFTAAWERPDAFRRVYSAIGTYVGMRGGEEYYVFVRKTEPKPIRIYMQDGVHDEWLGGPEFGDWWMSNETMNRALQFAGYDVNHTWGVGSHNNNHPTAAFAAAVRWLWRDYPAPIGAGQPGNPVLKTILQQGESWQRAATGCSRGTYIASNPRGEVFYHSGQQATALSDSSPAPCRQSGTSRAIAFGPDGKLYTARAEGGIQAEGGRVLGEGIQVRDFTVLNDGGIYATTAANGDSSQVWLISPNGPKVKLDDGLRGAAGIGLTPDHLWLFVAQNAGRMGLNYEVKADGTLDAKAEFYYFELPASADDSGAGGIAMDRDGRAYVATRLGVEVFDRNGRTTAILPLPGHEEATSITFGGPDFDTLFVAGDDKIYKRKMQIRGAPAWSPPITLPPGNGS